MLKDKKTGKELPVEAEKNEWGNLVISKEKGMFRLANHMEYEKSRLSETGPKLWLLHVGRCGKK
jgi:hypothetical protein